jgi:hypothetical protein
VKNDICIMIPSRGRPDNVGKLLANGVIDSLVPVFLAVDLDDPYLREYQAVARQYGAVVQAGSPSRPGVVASANRCSNFLAGWYDAVCYLGDDHMPRTAGFERRFVSELQRMGTGWVYGDDLLQGERLPTAGAMASNAIRALGWMFPPELGHLYSDNAWLDLGKASGCLSYLSNVVVEHLHPLAGKASMDEGYSRVNSAEQYATDYEAYTAWRNGSDFTRSVSLVKGLAC